jgi:hypothetical protein
VGRGSLELADAVFSDLVLSIHSCAQIRLIRSLPVKAGVGKVAELDRAHIHPDFKTTLGLFWLQVISLIREVNRAL